MKRTQHQKFVDQLRRQFNPDTKKKKNLRNSTINKNSETGDVMKDLERKFDELFGGDLDDED